MFDSTMEQRYVTFRDKVYDLLELSNKFRNVYDCVRCGRIVSDKNKFLFDVLEAEGYDVKFNEDHVRWFYDLKPDPEYVKKIFKNNTEIYKYGYFITNDNKLESVNMPGLHLEYLFDMNGAPRKIIYGLISKYFYSIKWIHLPCLYDFDYEAAVSDDIYQYSSYLYKYYVIKQCESCNITPYMNDELIKLRANRDFMNYYCIFVTRYISANDYLGNVHNISPEDINNDYRKLIKTLNVVIVGKIDKRDYDDVLESFKKLIFEDRSN